MKTLLTLIAFAAFSIHAASKPNVVLIMTEAVFTVNLKKGECGILAQFIGNDGKKYGIYFLNVERKD